MKDALGSYFNLTLLFIFILFISAFISLAINYTKAYRVKNNVLTYLEKYEGNANNEEMLEIVDSHIKSVGYKVSDENIIAAQNTGYECPKLRGQNQGWCYKKNRYNIAEKKDQFNIEIVVFINLNIPIINKVFSNVKFFWMYGSTNSIPILE